MEAARTRSPRFRCFERGERRPAIGVDSAPHTNDLARQDDGESRQGFRVEGNGARVEDGSHVRVGEEGFVQGVVRLPLPAQLERGVDNGDCQRPWRSPTRHAPA